MDFRCLPLHAFTDVILLSRPCETRYVFNLWWNIMLLLKCMCCPPYFRYFLSSFPSHISRLAGERTWRKRQTSVRVDVGVSKSMVSGVPPVLPRPPHSPPPPPPPPSTHPLYPPLYPHPPPPLLPYQTGARTQGKERQEWRDSGLPVCVLSGLPDLGSLRRKQIGRTSESEARFLCRLVFLVHLFAYGVLAKNKNDQR